MRNQITSYELLCKMVDAEPPEGDTCMDDFPRRRNKRGYVPIWTPGQRLDYAHRLVYELKNGPISDGKVICHKCDNPSCFRPDHLFVGTQADNIHDCMAKGRNNRGSTTHNAKLTEDAVREIRSIYGTGPFQREIAERFGISLTTVNQIVNRTHWKHVK